MLGPHKRRIFALGSMLRELEHDLTNLQLLLRLQLAVLAALKNTERASAVNRAQLKEFKHALRVHRLPKPDSLKLKAKIKRCEERLDHHKWLITVWRAFGDGIAFLYLDKWAIKPLLYNIHDPEAKDHPGSLLGKPGLANELRVLKAFIAASIPALLNDLTNCIRHGDICLLGSHDPVLIEVKSSTNTNARTQRQIDGIQSIHNYHRTDQATNVRGAPRLHRVALARKEIHYRSLLDQGISTALEVGHYAAEPEAGTRLVVTTKSTKKILDEVFGGFSPSAIYFLNQLKNENGWGVYFPYVLSIRSLENLYAFLDGKVFLLVAFDLSAISTTARRRGLSLTESTDAVWPIQVNWLKNTSQEPAFVRVSGHFLGRIACELLSWKWALSEERRRFLRFEREGLPSVA